MRRVDLVLFARISVREGARVGRAKETVHGERRDEAMDVVR